MGWCLNKNGSDQQEGFSMFPNPLEEIDCLEACNTMRKHFKVTGCEHNFYGACTYHTMPISGGSGHEGYSCWAMEKDRLLTCN